MRAPQALVEPVSQALIDDWGALSVSVEDADAGTEHEQARFGEPGMPADDEAWSRSVLRALFSQEADATAALLQLSAHAGLGEVALLGVGPVPEADWVRLTQSQFGPIEVCPDLWIVPSWHDPPAQARHVIRLDPGLAFGTGSHPTTRMCLRWIAQRPPGDVPMRVLDYGCGSGILAIAAAMLGAAQVDALDIDPAALRAAEDNARINGVQIRCLLPGQEQGPYDLVVANILATPLKLLAPLLLRALAPGARLLLAGLLEAQATDVAQAYAAALQLHVADTEDGWALLAGRAAVPVASSSA